eukprot:IDg16120t1
MAATTPPPPSSWTYWDTLDTDTLERIMVRAGEQALVVNCQGSGRFAKHCRAMLSCDQTALLDARAFRANGARTFFDIVPIEVCAWRAVFFVAGVAIRRADSGRAADLRCAHADVPIMLAVGLPMFMARSPAERERLVAACPHEGEKQDGVRRGGKYRRQLGGHGVQLEAVEGDSWRTIIRAPAPSLPSLGRQRMSTLYRQLLSTRRAANMQNNSATLRHPASLPPGAVYCGRTGRHEPAQRAQGRASGRDARVRGNILRPL